ncbi:MAG: CvpA family protein [Chloroflexota bacterium]|nr:CvpA family protein [Chloroflexota bacterium]
MIPIHTIFGGLLIFFALIGSLRGWAKEIIVAFSVVLGLFVEHVLVDFVLPLIGVMFTALPLDVQFFTRTALFIVITIFGYASPTIASRLGAKVARERLQDILLGFFLGLLNGFLIVGTLISFLNAASYGITPNRPEGIGGIIPPAPDSPSANLMAYMPPELIARSNVVLYVAVAAAFVFVIVVFI